MSKGVYYMNNEKDFEIMNATIFKCNKDLEEVIIPDNIVAIYDYAFEECPSLKKVTIGNSCKIIGDAAFIATAIEEFELPDSIETIGKHAFRLCSSLKSISLPKNIDCIDMMTFVGCTNLKTIKIPNRVTSIKHLAFGDCDNLEIAEIPPNVSSIDKDAFYRCKKLVIKGSAGSYAEKYAKENEIPFEAIEG